MLHTATCILHVSSVLRTLQPGRLIGRFLDGESVVQVSQNDTESLLLPNLIIDTDKGHVAVREDLAREIFYGDCSDEDVSRARSLLVPDAAAPFATPLRISEKNFGRIPRGYIECLRDRALAPSFQKKMYTALPCKRIISMDTSHSPFFSAPDELASNLMSVVAVA